MLKSWAWVRQSFVHNKASDVAEAGSAPGGDKARGHKQDLQMLRGETFHNMAADVCYTGHSWVMLLAPWLSCSHRRCRAFSFSILSKSGKNETRLLLELRIEAVKYFG